MNHRDILGMNTGTKGIIKHLSLKMDQKKINGDQKGSSNLLASLQRDHQGIDEGSPQDRRGSSERSMDHRGISGDHHRDQRDHQTSKPPFRWIIKGSMADHHRTKGDHQRDQWIT